MRILLIMVFIFSNNLNADIKSELKSFADSLGGGANGTDAGSFKGQSYRYYTGGRLFGVPHGHGDEPVTNHEI